MERPKFLFGDIVVVEEDKIGVIVKSWETYSNGNDYYNYDVYVRLCNKIINYKETEIDRYRVRHKYLSDEELEWQNG